MSPRLAIAAAGLALLAASGPGSATPKKAPPDPNREICKSRPAIGSRLQRIRECHSAAEWDDMKLAEQIGLGRQQFNGDSAQSAAELNGLGRLMAEQQPH